MKLGRRRLRAALAAWLNRARPEQLVPAGVWSVWLILTGRGWGKTRTGAETTALRMVNRPGIRVALVAQTFGDGRDTMVEGESGLLAVLTRYYGDGIVNAQGFWNRSMGELTLPNGSQAKVFSAEVPRKLRGPQHHFAWCDELAWWKYPRETWDALQFGLRLGDHPQTIITTSPRPIKLLRFLLSKDGTHYTSGTTLDNAQNLPEQWLADLVSDYGGTRTGQQELEGILLGEAEGARWTRQMTEAARFAALVPDLDRVVVGIDPAVTTEEGSDETGLAVVGRGPAPEGWQPPLWWLEQSRRAGVSERELRALPHLYLLKSEAAKLDPSKSMARAHELAELWDAAHVVIEKNNGGDYLPTVLRLVAPGTRYRVVHAVGSKLERAEPLAALYEQGRVHVLGDHEQLEDDQLSYTGAKKDPSPNVLDAAVHAAADLLPPVAPGRRPKAARRPAKLANA